MISGLIACAFGLAQGFVLKCMLYSFTAGNYTKAAVFMLIKLISYGIAAALLVFCFSDYIISCAVGFTVGLPLAVIAWFVYKAFFGKSALGDDKNENSNDN